MTIISAPSFNYHPNPQLAQLRLVHRGGKRVQFFVSVLQDSD